MGELPSSTPLRWPHRLSAVVLSVLAVLAIPIARRVGVDNRLERWLGDEGGELYERFREDFGSDEYVIVAVSGRPLFEEESLDGLVAALERLEEIPQVTHVSGLPAVYRDLFGEEDPEELREEFLSTPFYRGIFLSRDGEVAGLLVETSAEPTALGRREMVHAIEDAVAPLGESGFRVHLAGPPVLNAALDEASQREARRTLPIALAGSVIVLVLLLGFRGTVVAFTCAAVSILLTLGLIGLAGRPLNMITAALPALLWVLSLANIIHLIRTYQTLRSEAASVGEALQAAYAETWFPCTLSALTTAAGFASLTAAAMEPVQELGVFAAAGMLFSLATNLSLGPTLLQALRVPAPGRPSEQRRWTLLSPGRISPSKILIPSALLFVVMLFSLTALETQTNPLLFFPANAKIKNAYAFVGDRLTGVHSLELVIHTPGGWLSSEYWPALEDLSRRLEGRPEVSRIISPLDLLKKLNQWDHDFDPQAYALPETSSAASILVEELDETGEKELQRLVSPDGDDVRLSVLINEIDSEAFGAITRAASAALLSLPDPLSGDTTGIVLRLVTAQLNLVKTQLMSFAWAFGVVFLCIFVGLRSWRLTLASVPPNLLPILAAFTYMAVVGIVLDVATVMMASVALGIGVDDTVHFLARFQRERRRAGSVAEGVRSTLTAVGPALATTTVTACVGFFALTGSAFVPIRHFGVLSGLAVALALLADVLLLPAILIAADRRGNGE